MLKNEHRLSKKLLFGVAPSIVLIVLVGLVNLPIPFHGDQALFSVGAKAVLEGKVLYRDFWDLKQPGIYYFYLLGSSLFGFSESGIHLFELIYMVIFALTLVFTLKSYFKEPAILGFVPILTVGLYYAVASTWHLTQLEALVEFPIFLSLYFSCKAVESNGRWRILFFILSGLTGGIVLLFKLMFLMILIPFWVNSVLYLSTHKRRPLAQSLVELCAGVVLGLLVALSPVAIYFYFQGSLSAVYETFFIYPPQISSRVKSVDINRLFHGFFWFLRSFAPAVGLAILGSYFTLKERRDLLFINLISWCIFGLAVTWIQRHAWWEYHYMVLLVPIGVLAARGLDIFWGDFKERRVFLSSSRSRLFALLLIGLLSLLPLRSFVKKVSLLTVNQFAMTSERRIAYQSALNASYPVILSEVNFLSKPDALPGDIFVLGDPLMYFLSGRGQAIATNGWSPELFLPSQWEQLKTQLSVAKPPYIFVDDSTMKLIRNESPALLGFVQDTYSIFSRGGAGNWYKLRV